MTAENIFLKYISNKYKDVDMLSKSAGPVITISREIGCLAGDVAESLTNKINKKLEKYEVKRNWTWISKEILEKSANELHIKKEDIAHIFDGKARGLLEDFALSFFKNFYVSDDTIKCTIKYIVRSMAYEGNVIIVGRAGCIITKDISRSMHIKLIAPVSYRNQQLCKTFHLTQNEAKDLIRDIDKKRRAFMKFYSGGKDECCYYDIILNCTKFDHSSLVDLLYHIGEKKGLY